MEVDSGACHLTHETLESFVRRVPIVLLSVSFAGEREVPESALQYFKRSYGADFAYATIDAAHLPYPTWIVPILHAARPLVGGGFGAVGSYLFLAGKAVAYHGGENLPAIVARLAAFAVTRVAVGDQSGPSLLTAFDPLIRASVKKSNTTPACALPPTDYDRACRVLGVHRDASVEDVEAARRKKLAEYHPDKVTHVSAAFVDLATEKMKEISWAADLVRRERGMDRSAGRR